MRQQEGQVCLMIEGKTRMAAYTRVSTSKEDQLNSLENQNSFYSEYAKKMGYELVNIYADEGISGLKLKNRHRFNQLMEDARRGRFDLVVTKDISRISRNTVDFLTSIRELRMLGIDTLFLTNNQTVIGQGEVTLGILSILAQEESNNISKRTKWGKEQRSKQEGTVPSSVYGYNTVKIELDTHKKRSALQINETEANVIKDIFTYYTCQGHGALKIAHMLNERNIYTKRHSQWTQVAVCRILKNELYIGRLINRKQDTIDYLTSKRKTNDREDWIIHDYPDLRIIDNNTFYTAQKMLEQHQEDFKTAKTRHSNKYIFSTLIKCTCCGFSFRRIETTYANTYTRWICSGRNTHGRNSCWNLTVIDEQELLDSIKEYFCSIIMDKQGFVDKAFREFNKLYASNLNKNSELKSTAATKKELDRLEAKRNRLLEAFADGMLGKADLKQRLDPIDLQIKMLREDIRSEGVKDAKPARLREQIKEMFSSMENIIHSARLSNADLKKIIDRIEVNAEGEVNVILKKAAEINIGHSL